MADIVTISSGELTASISVMGAELQSLKDAQWRELMTDADPAYWSGHAPLLFPIVGRLNNDALRVDGQEYAMPKHGFARKSCFDLVEVSATDVLFRLIDSAKTRAQYPFTFELNAHFRVEGATLCQTVKVRNTGSDDLPFSFGYHPAFTWPLPFGGAREAHIISFEHDELAPVARVTPYGTIAHDVPTPVVGKTLSLHDELFVDDALVWRELASRRLSYGATSHPSLEISFPDTAMLGIWTKPGSAFMCIEPWAGIADPEGYAGDFIHKPGIISLPPGETRQFRMDVALQS